MIGGSSLARRGRRTAAPAGATWAALVIAVAAAPGCARTLDMAEIHDERRAETTIRYLGVRGETRLYPDYSGIDARILGREEGAGGGPGASPGGGARP